MAPGMASSVMLGLLLGLICAAGAVHAREFTVGDGKGWSLGVSGWENGKPIHAGDVLVFKYDPKMHNVVKVDEAAYRSCRTPNGGETYTSGLDKLAVHPGKNFFICSIGEHCARGMKIAVTA